MNHSFISELSTNQLAPNPELIDADDRGFWNMTKKIVRIAVPTILAQVFALLVIASNTAFIGHLGDAAKLAGVGLGTLYINIFCQSIILGLNGAVATLVSQAYGAGNLRKCGILLNRGRLVAILAFIPILVVLLLCEEFFLAIGMDPAASSYASIYTYYLIPAMFFHSQFDATRNYLNALHKAYMVMITMIITSSLHMMWCYLFVFVWEWDILGVSIATFITYFLNFAVITIYCRLDKDVRKSFFFFTKESFQELGQYLKIGIPSTTMLCMEWWSFEVLAIMAGYISVEATGAHVIVLNTHVVIIMVPIGAQVASIVTVGHSMGEGDYRKAQIYYKLVLFYTLLLNFIIAIVIFSDRELFARIYTNQDELIPQVTQAYTVMLAILLIHGIALVQAGAIRGLGMFKLANVVVFIAFYIVTLPAAYAFAFPLKYGMTGLWLGVVVGAVAEVILYFLILMKTDWPQLAIDISLKMRISKSLDDFNRTDNDSLNEPLLNKSFSRKNTEKVGNEPSGV